MLMVVHETKHEGSEFHRSTCLMLKNLFSSNCDLDWAILNSWPLKNPRLRKQVISRHRRIIVQGELVFNIMPEQPPFNRTNSKFLNIMNIP